MKRKNVLLTIVSVVLILIQVELDLSLPAVMSRMTVLLEKKGTGMQEILAAGGKMLVFALGSLCASCITAVCVAALSASVGGSLRQKVFHQVMRFSMAETDAFSSASLLTRSTNDVTQVQTFLVMGLQVMVKAPITAIGAIHKVSGTVWQWTAVTAAGTGLMIVFVLACIALILPKQKKAQVLMDDLTRIADDDLSGMAVIHAYNAEDQAEKKFSKTNAGMTDNNLFAMRAMAVLSPGVQLILNGMTLAIYGIGAVLISTAGTMARAGLFASMLAFAQYAVQIVNAFVTLTMVFTMIPRAMVSFRRISEVLHAEPSVKDEGTLQEGSEKGTVTFEHVDFCYPGETNPTLKDISFSVKKGETLAIIGSTGSGKSTLVNLIPRFYDASGGTIRIDGKDIRSYSLKALRDKIGYCSQQAELLSGTLRENVCYGKPEEENVEKALQASQAEEFIAKKGLDAVVNQGGTNFSGGQKQRLALARALADNPEILILDDTASALDYDTEKKLWQALSEAYPDTTKIVITQRIRSVAQADQILVLNEGRLAGKGTHEELLQTCPVYQEIAMSQKGEVSA